MGLLPQGSGFTFVVNPSTAMICTGFFHERIAVALQYSPSTKTFPPLAWIGGKRVHSFSRHRFFADLNRQTLRAVASFLEDLAWVQSACGSNTRLSSRKQQSSEVSHRAKPRILAY
jgi:hypothetical protein